MVTNTQHANFPLVMSTFEECDRQTLVTKVPPAVRNWHPSFSASSVNSDWSSAGALVNSHCGS
jgi:hypothetical protein